jgi:SAM-dependent methyltransferase
MDVQYYRNQRPEMLDFIPARRSRVLEVGCGEATFIGSLPGVEEAWGIEPSAAADIARGRLHRVFHATYDEAEADLPLAYFDVIICNDVIEHMPDHDSFLARVAKHLVPGGMLVGSIPNVRYYNNLFEMMIEKDWHYRDSGILDRTHFRFFTGKSLAGALRRNGYRVERMRGINAGNSFAGAHRAWLYLPLSWVLIAVTLGYFSDIRFLQFGFQATPKTS